MHEVSRKTITVWKASGLIVMSGNAVDVEASNARLARYRPGRHTHRAKAARLTPEALPTFTPEQEILTTREGDIHSQGFRAGFSAALYHVAAAMPRLVAEAARQSGERSADALDAAMRPLLLREFAEILAAGIMTPLSTPRHSTQSPSPKGRCRRAAKRWEGCRREISAYTGHRLAGSTPG